MRETMGDGVRRRQSLEICGRRRLGLLGRLKRGALKSLTGGAQSPSARQAEGRGTSLCPHVRAPERCQLVSIVTTYKCKIR